MISGIDYGKGNDESCTVTFVSPEYIKNLEEENNQLKERKKELRSWLEECLNELKQNDVYDRTSYEMGQIIATECIIEKLNELEGVNNDR